MNDQIHSQLSTLHDGELSELELRSLLKQLHNCNDAERAALLQKWSRYQVIAEALADERGSHVAGTEFAAAVGELIEREPVPASDTVDSVKVPASKTDDMGSTDWQTGASAAGAAAVAPLWSRFAVAASVALAVVVGVQQYQLSTAPTGTIVAHSAAVDRQPALAVESLQLADASSQTGTRKIAASDSIASEKQKADALRAQQRLHEYMLEHANHAARQNGQGIAPFARVANFEVESN